MKEDQAQELIKKLQDGTATTEETRLLEEWLLQYRSGESGLADEELQSAEAHAWKHILEEQSPAKHIRLWPRIAAVASILIAISAGGYFLLHKQSAAIPQTTSIQKLDIAPGNQGAILQLSNGQQISLSQAKVGNIATQANTNITKTVDNKIVYSAAAPSTELVYNTIKTKRGNFYPLTLSDGTVAILDAGSSIKYPVAFAGHERKVEITGQVYFEVKHNAQMPFRVMVKGHTIEDIGTQFNINAYDDEPNIKTTLIEGSIKINNQKVLIPGQQAIIKDGQITIDKNTNIEEAIAWKNGFFKFNDTQIADVMRQLSRWYNVDIEYPNGMPHTIFNGKILRNTNASQVLEILSFSNVHFQIVKGPNGEKNTGKTIIFYNNRHNY